MKSINQVVLLTIAVGAVIAFWMGKDAGLAGAARREEPALQAPATPARSRKGALIEFRVANKEIRHGGIVARFRILRAR